MTLTLLVILAVTLLSLLVIVAGDSVRGLLDHSKPFAPSRALRSLFGVSLRAPAAGEGSPDYAMTGQYWCANYWPIYWPCGIGNVRGCLLGNGLVVSGRGVSGAM